MAVNHFGSEWIESSKKVLFELCPGTGQRCVAHKGQQKDAKNVKSCLKLLNEVDINQRLSVIEQPSSSKGNAATIMACEGAQFHGPSHRKPASGPSALAVAEETAGGGSATTMSPPWRGHRHCASKHKQRPGKRSTAVQSKTSMNPHREKKT
ncbi:unnamed protein product [Gadus morhua 'NCC']